MDNIEKVPFLLLKQNSLGKEKVSFNGIQKVVHVVVKNQPFLLQVKFENAKVREKVELQKLGIETQLLYDTETLKEVAYVKVRPLDSKSHRGGGENGEVVTVEVKIKVLSSQLEDSFFRIKLIPVNTTTKEILHPNWFVISDPLKVVSKPEQIRKKKSSTPKPTNTETAATRKRDKSEELAQHLAQVEAQCLQQQILLTKLYEDAANQKEIIQQLGPVHNRKGKDEMKALTAMQQFEQAFQSFLRVSDNSPLEERPEKIRKLVHHQTRREKDTLTEMVETFHVLLADQDSFADPSSLSQGACQCSGCPYQRELEMVFNTDFLSVNSNYINPNNTNNNNANNTVNSLFPF